MVEVHIQCTLFVVQKGFSFCHGDIYFGFGFFFIQA